MGFSNTLCQVTSPNKEIQAMMVRPCDRKAVLRDWLRKSCRLHLRERDPEVDQRPGIPIITPTWLGVEPRELSGVVENGDAFRVLTSRPSREEILDDN